MSENNEMLLKAILASTARQTFPVDKLLEIVRPRGSTEKQVHAFNTCDGTKGQTEIAKSLKLDPGNFSRTVSRWIDEGVVFRLGKGREAKLLHVYPLPSSSVKSKGDQT